tara:strand:- start:498 stop:752 length:255 start_codon:yes stop_codon:yes gene_type:complete
MNDWLNETINKCFGCVDRPLQPLMDEEVPTLDKKVEKEMLKHKKNNTLSPELQRLYERYSSCRPDLRSTYLRYLAEADKHCNGE